MNHSSSGDCAAQPRDSYLMPNVAAALEVLGYLAVLAAGILCFLNRWLASPGAAVLTVLLLLSLIVLSWRRFDGGRHPCFFFLCALTVFQAGRLLAYCAEYCAGDSSDIFQINLMTSTPFDVPPQVEGTVLLALALSAICIYAPCRWRYDQLTLTHSAPHARFLPYLYLLFCGSLPIQLFKNYRYYEYAQSHGGYLVFFTDHGGMAASIPLPVRAISLLSLPALAGIFVLEDRKKRLATAAVAYFAMTAPVLLTGSRGAIFSLILSLWYVSKVKSKRPARLSSLGLLVVGLGLTGSWIGALRGDTRPAGEGSAPAQFLAQQGSSLNVTEIAVAYRSHFSPHIFSYLKSELQSAFVTSDQTHYVAGSRFADDVAMFLSPAAYQSGLGSGSAYLAEAFVFGELWGVVLVSTALGVGLHQMHVHSRNPSGLFLVAMIFPDVLWMTRGGLLDWASSCLRIGVSVILLALGWWLYRSAATVWHALVFTGNAGKQNPEALPGEALCSR